MCVFFPRKDIYRLLKKKYAFIEKKNGKTSIYVTVEDSS